MTMAADVKLIVELDGTAAGTGYDRHHVSGVATNGASLKVLPSFRRRRGRRSRS